MRKFDTEREQTESNATQESYFLRQLLDGVDAGVLVYNFDLERTTYVNRFVEDLHGKSLSAVPDHHYLDDTHPDDYERVIDYGRTVLPNLADDEVATIEYRIIDQDGQTRWVLVHDRVLTRGDDGHVIENLGIMIDITERKALEAELDQLSRRFQALFNHTSDGVTVSSFGTSYDDSRLLAANQRIADIAGYPLEELYNIRPSQALMEDELEAAVDRRERLAAGDESARVVERRGKRKDGTIFYVESLVIPIRDDDGRITETMMFARDITERKQREQEIIEARMAAETALKARDTFIANMSHELRNPLNTIQGFAQLLLERPDLPPGAAEDLQAIDASTGHLTRLITDVLDLSRVEAGFDRLHPVNCAVHEVFERLEKVVRLQARRKGLDLRVEVAADVPPLLRLDEVKLKQIIINLIDNAIKYTDAGGITVQVRATAENHLRCVVADTGPGLPDELQMQVFQPFTRGQQAAESAIPGSGLGLSISSRLVALMGGGITVHSTTAGTQVVVDLPFEPAAVETPRSTLRTRKQAVLAGGRHRVLVVDDESDERRLMEIFLQSRGLTVVTSKSGLEALEIIVGSRPDLIFIDLRMPRLDGADTVTRIRQQEPDNIRTPIVALTADAVAESRQRLLNAGCDEVIYKPYQLSDIADVLARYLVLARRPAPQPGAAAGLTTETLSILPQDWLWSMYDICVTGRHTDAIAYVALIADDYPLMAQTMIDMLNAYRTTQIADLIAPLLD